MIPAKFYMLGGGRHASSRQTRRSNEFARRVFRIGGYPVRPGRRVDVSIDFLAANFQEVCAHIQNGTLLIQHSHDDFVDVDELSNFVAEYRGERPPPEPVEAATEPEPVLESEPPILELEPEPEPEVHEEPEQFEVLPEPEALPEPDPELDDEEPEESEDEPSEAVTVRPPAGARTLPEGFGNLKKKDLLALCKERGLNIDPKRVPSNASLINLLLKWRDG